MGAALIEYLQAAKEAGNMPDVLVTDGLTSVRHLVPPQAGFRMSEQILFAPMHWSGGALADTLVV
jgi:hypothetical protein